MSAQPIFRLLNRALLVALASVFPVTLYAAEVLSSRVGAEATCIMFFRGDATAVDMAGVQRKLTTGDAIRSGETVRTGDGGMAQISFPDGAMVSLQPKTELRIDNSKNEGMANGNAEMFFRLGKGGVRFNGTSSQMAVMENTVVDMSGNLTAALDESGHGLAVTVDVGHANLCNTIGCAFLNSGESGTANNSSQPQLSQTSISLPTALPDEVSLPIFSSGDNKNQDGYPPNSFRVIGIGGSTSFIRDANVFFNGNGSMRGFTSESDSLTLSQGTAQVAEFGGDSIVKWERWTNGSMTINNQPVVMNANQGEHFVWGVPTPSMPTSGIGNYTLLGGTRPTETTGAWAPGVLNHALLSVNFGTLAVFVDVSVTMVGGTYDMSGMSSFAGNRFDVIGLTASGPGVIARSSADLNVRFFGATAERASIVYKIQDFHNEKTIIGSAALKR